MEGGVADEDATPEQLLISALLDHGAIDVRIDDDHIKLQAKTWRWIRQYEADAGTMPPLELLQRKFPQFVHIPGVSLDYALANMARATRVRLLSAGMASAARSLADDADGEAIKGLRAAMDAATTVTRHVVRHDSTEIVPVQATERIAVPGARLMAETGGQPMSSIWMIVASTGVGKTWRLCQHAVAAAESGRTVSFMSLEMPWWEISERLQMLYGTRMAGRAFLAMDERDRRAVLARWKDEHPSVAVQDAEAAVRVEDIAAEAELHDLVVVDYIGRVAQGRRPGQSKDRADYEMLRDLAEGFKEAVRGRRAAIVTAAQANRSAAESKGRFASIGLDKLSRSYSMAEAFDLGLTMNKVSRRIILNRIDKNRHGRDDVSWPTLYDPSSADFSDLTPDQASAVADADSEEMMEVKDEDRR